MPALPTALDSLVRRVDEDRWLASRFAPAPARERLIALYAVNYEIARTAEVVREPALGDIRLEWWRAAVADVAAGQAPPSHPALNALRQVWVTPESLTAFDALIAARRRDFDADALIDPAQIEAYVDATSGVLMRLAVEACDPGALDGARAFIEPAARAWGFTGLLRAGRAQDPIVVDRAIADYARARPLARHVPPAAFAAIGYVTLVPAYLRAWRTKRPGPSLLMRQARLIGAAATGRV